MKSATGKAAKALLEFFTPSDSSPKDDGMDLISLVQTIQFMLMPVAIIITIIVVVHVYCKGR